MNVVIFVIITQEPFLYCSLNATKINVYIPSNDTITITD